MLRAVAATPWMPRSRRVLGPGRDASAGRQPRRRRVHAVVRMADGRTTALDFRETAPAAASSRHVPATNDGSTSISDKSLFGATAAGVPGSPAGIVAPGRSTSLGTMSLAEDLAAPAIALASRRHRGQTTSWRSDAGGRSSTQLATLSRRRARVFFDGEDAIAAARRSAGAGRPRRDSAAFRQTRVSKASTAARPPHCSLVAQMRAGRRAWSRPRTWQAYRPVERQPLARQPTAG